MADALNQSNLGTLLFDLLTELEEDEDRLHGRHRFDIDLLTRRLLAATDWLAGRWDMPGRAIGYFGASTGAAAAIAAAAVRPETVRAVVSRGGRPDLAGEALRLLRAPILLIVGSRDHSVIELNQGAAASIRAPKEIRIVRGASHLFEEPGTLDEVADLAREWFVRHLVHLHEVSA